jgi:transposase
MQSYRSKIVFKDYTPKQMMLLPPSLEELIEENHPVRIVERIVEKIDIELLTKTYKGGGTSSYNPKMLLKVLIYAYLRNVYSTRGIEDQLKENIHFMWLSGMSRPDHNTIYRFRSKRLKGEIKKIFALVVAMLAEEGIISIEEAYLDGTKIEANANRYTFVWRKTIKNNRDKIKEQLEGLWSYVEQVYKSEQEEL